jgi:hypothetical protein
MLTDERQVRVIECVQADQLITGSGNGQETLTLSGGQDRTTGHAVSFFLKTTVCDKPAKAIGVTREIKVLRFSKIALEMLFSISYYCNEFR